MGGERLGLCAHRARAALAQGHSVEPRRLDNDPDREGHQEPCCARRMPALPVRGRSVRQARAGGPPIKDYFPRVVSDEEFEQAQPATNSVPRGRPHKRIHLLSGLLVDPRQRKMYAQAQAGGKFPHYQTAPSLVEYGESAVRWSAEHLERCVVAACREIDWNRLYATDTTEQERLEAQISALNREESSIARKLANAAEAVLEGGLGEAIKAQVELHEARLPVLRSEKKQLETALEQLRRASGSSAQDFAEEIPTEYEPRERLQAQLRTVLKRVQVWPDGRTPDPFWRQPLEYASEWAPKTSRQSISHGEVMGACRLFFKNERAITAYVTFVRVGKNRAARVIGFANPHGMTTAEWDEICSHAGMYAPGAEAEPRVPTTRRRVAKR